MYKKNFIYLLNMLKIVVIIAINIFSLIFVKEKNNIYFLFIILTNIILFLSFTDLFKIIKRKEYLNYLKFANALSVIVYNILVVLSFFICILLYKTIFKKIYFTLIYDSSLLIIYLLVFIIFIRSSDNSNKKFMDIDKNHNYFKLLKNELVNLKNHKNFPNKCDIIDIILDFVSYHMTLKSSNNSGDYEKQIAKCITLCNEALDKNNIEELMLILSELYKILNKREKELNTLYG